MNTNCSSIELRKASAGEMAVIYEWMKKQFHPGELKPLWLIKQMREQGLYEIYVLYDQNEMVAYALFGISRDGRMHLLDYLAVLPEHQAAGYGSVFLSMLRSVLQGDAILLEVEDPDFTDDERERAVCLRRFRFYDRNACVRTGLRLNLYGFDYVILTIPLQTQALSDERIQEALCGIYSVFFPPEEYRTMVNFKA